MQLRRPQDSLGTRLAAGTTGGFDYLRLILSVGVMFWHSWAVIQQGHDPSHAVKVIVRSVLPLFFALSGFLVASSLERLQNLPMFLAMRFLRIFPALIVETVLSALLLGPLLTTVALSDYFTSPVFWTYFRNLYGDIQYLLPGVFETHPSHQVNASLWTVPFELECYVGISLLYLVRFFRRAELMLAAVVGLSIYWSFRDAAFSWDASYLVSGRILLLCFLAGNVVFKWRDWLPAGGALGWAGLGLCYLLLIDASTVFLLPLVAAYTAAALGCSKPKRVPIIFNGDYSYGVYLYAYPIQQAVYAFTGTTIVPLLFIVALTITSLFAAFSWHFVEKPTLKLKNYLRRRTAPPAPRVEHAQGKVPVTPT